MYLTSSLHLIMSSSFYLCWTGLSCRRTDSRQRRVDDNPYLWKFFIKPQENCNTSIKTKIKNVAGSFNCEFKKKSQCNIQGDQLNMAVLSFTLEKQFVQCTRVQECPLDKSQGTRKTWPCLTCNSVQIKHHFYLYTYFKMTFQR